MGNASASGFEGERTEAKAENRQVAVVEEGRVSGVETPTFSTPEFAPSFYIL
jgi:hypothetical protein